MNNNMPYFLQVHTWNLMVEQDTYRWEDSFCRPTGGSPWYRPRYLPAGPKTSQGRLSYCNPWLFGMNIGDFMSKGMLSNQIFETLKMKII